MTKPFMKRALSVALTIILMFVVTASTIYSFIDMAHHTHTRGIDAEMKSAVDYSNTLPPGIDRAQALVDRLRKITPGWAPDEVTHALAEYIAALQADIDAFKAGKEVEAYDQALQRAQQKLTAAIKKNWE